MQKYFHFTITCDARRQIPKMILERLVDEYIWQGQQYESGVASVKDRAKRVKRLITAEVDRRTANREFERLLSNKLKEEQLEQTV